MSARHDLGRPVAKHDWIAAKRLAALHMRRGMSGAASDELARMRCAWVAYHAGAPWMWGRLEQSYWDELARLRAENEQLVAAVLDARLPSVTEAERESLRAELLIMRHERDEARAEVERLRRAMSEARAYIGAGTPGIADSYLRGALARGDGGA